MIQPATVGTLFASSTSPLVSPSASATSVEPISQTVERLKLASFYGDDIVKECQASSAKSLVEEGLRVRVVRGTNLLHIEYAASSPAVAESCVAKVFERLKQYQAAVGAPLIKALEDQLASTKRQVESRERYIALLEARGARAVSPTSGESILMLLKSEELIKLTERYQYESRVLTEPFTQPAKLLGPISASEEAVSRKKSAAAIGFLIGGLCFGLLALFLTRGWSRYKSYLRRLERQDAQ